ncbi:hypothetical protein Rleg4DRAFT_4633 [Rhizobium leguminosarum bv. trifolii WSM2297]|uniref:Uncharacterized protein n=1 Tax=Rhizobium leguminosarum bv. trifolii WSM2297 TaxID=754762 RepID=J0WCG8_RHILT|nr:hypothetical protein [Rhizobium leguminosarum]EJC82903.1 hypothetical protein Rleg4DRAFT_4633 [Rhizobium leguminosarum bv. trifolii WSM2297]
MRVIRFIALLAATASIGYRLPATAGSLDEDAFRNIPIGKTTKLSNLSPLDAEAICLLQPYQDRLSSKDALAARVNEYLAANNYVAGEGHFAFVLVGKDAIEIAAFNRSQELDVLAEHGVSSSVEKMLPKGFAAHDCASGQFAAFIKIGFRERTYVVLGEAH